MEELTYLPWAALDSAQPFVVVNGPHDPRARLELSNWPGSNTPREFAADTGAETVLRFLRSPTAEVALRELRVASSPRFDGGALLALWALLSPAQALANAQRLIAAARAAEFGVGEGIEARAFVCTVNAFQNPDESPLGPALAALSEDERSTRLFEALLPQVGAMLENIRAFDLLWFGEYSDVLQSEHLLESGAVQVESVPELDLVVLDTPLRLHPLVALTATTGFSRLLTVRSENTYSLTYRYESWVRYQSYRPLPRIELGRLATRLNMFELHAGSWRADAAATPTAALYLDDGRGGPTPSSLDRETALAEMLEYLRAHQADERLHWRP
jgi:hypothetical protein